MVDFATRDSTVKIKMDQKIRTKEEIKKIRKVKARRKGERNMPLPWHHAQVLFDAMSVTTYF